MSTEDHKSSSPSSVKSPPLSWKTKLTVFLATTAMDLSTRSDGTVNRFFFNLLNPKSPPTKNPINGVKSSDITVDPTRNLWFRLFIPTTTTTTTTLPILIFFHGGGFTFFSPDTKIYDDVGRRFATTLPAVVISVNYRFSPEHKYPSQYEDGLDVLKFLDEGRCEELPKNADLSRCFIAGDSAGGNLAHHVTIRSCKQQFLNLKVAGLIAIQAYFGGEERTESEIRLEGAPLVSLSRSDWHWKAFLPEGSDRDHEAANVSGPNSIDISSLKKFPATMVISGGFDPLRDWQKRYYEWLKMNGKEVYLVDYPNGIHCFYAVPELPESAEFFEEVKGFVNKQSS